MARSRKARTTTATLNTRGGRHGSHGRAADRGRQRPRHAAKRVANRSGSERHQDEVVASRGAEAACDSVRLHAAGRSPGERANAFRRLADEIRLIAGRLERRARAGADCVRHLPLNDADAMSIDERISAGDRAAVIDAGVEDANAILEVCHRMSETLTDGDCLIRLAECRMRQARTGRQWRGMAVSGPFDQETAATDCGGKEPRRIRGAGRNKPSRQGGRRGLEKSQC